MAENNRDVLEQILKRLNVTDLIRCKSVCKFWETLISDHRFIKIHMNHSYQIDCNNNDVDRRIVMARGPTLYGSRDYEVVDRCFDYQDCHRLCSSNGLVCIYPLPSQFLVVNPATREVRRLNEPQIPDTSPLCWGFGYDSSTNDYKVVLGFAHGGGLTRFQVLTLKSNVWKVIGYMSYSIVSKIGIFYNGALHWVMKDASSQNNKNVILSFCLSEDEFYEIPQPNDARYESGIACLPTMRLGIMEECLCVFRNERVIDNLWMMKNYSVKESWEIVRKDWEGKPVLNFLKDLKLYIPHKRFYTTREWFISAPIYVESLVSPYVNGKTKRKIQESNIKKSCKLIRGDPSAPAPNGKLEEVEAARMA